MAALNLFPARVPFVDPQTGLLTATAQRALAQLLERVGGPTAPNINELVMSDDEDSGLEELRHEFTKAIDGLGAMPSVLDAEFGKDLQALHLSPAMHERPVDEFLLTQVASLQSLVAELRKEVEDMKQGQML